MNSTTGSKYLTPCRSLGLSKVQKKTPSSGGLAKVGVTAKSINSPFSSPLISDEARTVPLVKKKQSAVHSTLWSTPLINKSRFKMGLSKSSGKHSLGKAKNLLRKPGSLMPKALLDIAPKKQSSDPKHLMSCGTSSEQRRSSEQRVEEDCVVPQLESYAPEKSSVAPKCESPKDLLAKTPHNKSLDEPDLLCSISLTESHHTESSPDVLVQNYSSDACSDASENNEFCGWDPINDAEDNTESQSKMNILQTYIRNIDNNSTKASQELETSDHQVRCPHIEKDLAPSEDVGLLTEQSRDAAPTTRPNEANVAMGSLQNGDIVPIEEKPYLSDQSSPSTAATIDISHSMSFTDDCETPQTIANSTMEVSQPETKSSSVDQWAFKTPLPRDLKTYNGKTCKRSIASSKKSALNRTKQRVLDRLGPQAYRGSVSITNGETKVNFLAARNTVNPSFLESFSEDEDIELKNDMRKWLKGGRRVIDEIIEEVRLQKDRNMTVMEVLQEQGVDPNLVGFDPDREEFISFEKFLLKNNIG